MAVKRKHEAYGCTWETDDPVKIELGCIRKGGSWQINGQQCGAGLAHHIVQFSRHVWPWFKWHRWATDIHLPELCQPRHRLAVFGPSSSGKSALTALVYLIFYFARPNHTTVMVSSTTRDELELRIWGELKLFFREAKEQHDWLPGNLTESKQIISTDGKGEEFGRDVRNGIVCRPCKIGNKWVVGGGMSPYQGIKNDYVYVAADEFGIMPPGIMDALSNLTSNPQCCASFLGNLGDLDTPLGSAAEPDKGWDSIHDSDVSWAYNTRWTNGRAIQFIGMDSPNLDFPADAEPYPKLIGRRYIEQCANDYGRDTPFFNMFAAGKIPRGTMENRVITKAVCERHHAFEPVIWGHERLTRIYAADLSYTIEHGDRTVGRPFQFGRCNDGKMRLAPLEPPKVYAPNDRSSFSIEEQIASEMMAECKRLEIPPSHVFFDGTGRSSFTAAIMRVWSIDVVPVEFGGAATMRPNFVGRRYHEDRHSKAKQGDLLPCSEVFGKFVTELWFAWRALVESDQCRALDMDTVREGALRIWKLTMGNRMDVEPKKEMKLRLGRSPDLADCLVTGLEGARRLGFPLGQADSPNKQSTQWISRLNRDYLEARESSELVTA